MVRRELGDEVPISDMAGESQIQRSRMYMWVK